MRRITRNDLRGLYEPAPQSLYDGIHEALADLPDGKEQRKVKKKIGTGFILAAVLLALSAAGFAANQWDLFRSLTRSASPIVPLDSVDKLVEANLGSAENEWITVAVEQAAYDGQGINVMVRLMPKDPESYALFNAWLMDAPEDEYVTEIVPVPVPEGTQELHQESTVKVVNEKDDTALYVDGAKTAIPASREAAEDAGLPVYMDEGALYYADQGDFEIVGRRDGRRMLYFDVGMRPASGDGTVGDIVNGMSIDAEAQNDGSVLVWFDGFADEPLPDSIELELSARVWFEGEQEQQGEALDAIAFELGKSEDESTARYAPEGDGMIGDHVHVREVNVSFTKVRAYLTVDYDYEERPEEDMGVWLNPYDTDGNAITTGNGGCYAPDEGEKLGFYRQSQEMQSLDEIPDVIVLGAKVIGGDSLGRCACRLVRSE